MLRLDDLQIPPLSDSKQFERMLRDLFSAELDDPFVRLHGRSGHRQHGVDVVALPRNANAPLGIQAKEKNLLLGSELTIPELRNEVEKARGFHPGLETLILATTAARDGELQREALALTMKHRRRKLFDVHLYFWEDICSMLQKHQTVAADYYPTLFPNGATKVRSKKSRSNRPIPVLVTLDLLRVVGLVVVAPGPVFSNYFAQIFPETVTKARIRRLLTVGYLEEDEGILTVPSSIARELRKDEAFCKEQLSLWESSLAPLQGHADLAAYQAVLFMRTDRANEAVELLCDISQGLEPGVWNSHYLAFLKPLDQAKLLSRINSLNRLKLLNSLGLCHSRDGNQAEAIAYYDRLLTEAKKKRNSWAIGQALINKGVAYNSAGDDVAARDCYQRAASHAKRSRDDILLGRSLHNLAQLVVYESPELAEEYLKESAAAKRRGKDHAGEVATILTRGLIMSQCGKFKEAEKLFTRGEKIAKRNDQRYERAIALCNLGRVNVDLQRYAKARKYFVEAEKLCSRERFQYPTDLAVEGIALSHVNVGERESAIKNYKRLSESKDEVFPLATRLRATINLCELHCSANAPNEAWKHVRCLLEQSEEFDVLSAVLQAVSAVVASESNCGRGRAALTELDRLKKIRLSDPSSYPAILEAGLTGWKFSQLEAPMAQTLAKKCRSAWRKARGTEGELRSMQLEASWAWESQQFSEATTILSKANSLAKSKKCLEVEGFISKQLGTCFEELENHDAAKPLFQRSIAIAKSLKHSHLFREASNNLGELLRRSGHPKEALKWFMESEKASLADEAISDAISTRHNRALALHQVGQKKAATSLLRKIYEEAVRIEDTHEAVRALHGIAILAEVDSPPGASVPLFKRALKEADRFEERSEFIVHNLASALRRSGRTKEAAPLLQRAVDNWKGDPFRYRKLWHAANAWDEAGDPSMAKRCWERVLREAKVANDQEYVAMASASLSNFAAESKNFKKAWKLLDQALKNEPIPEDRVFLRMDQIELALDANWENKIGPLYRKFNTEVLGHPDQYQLLVDLHMRLGDYAWEKPKHRLRAVEAYTAAIAFAASGLDPNKLSAALAHVMSTLLLPRPANVEECEKQLRHAREWIKRQAPLKKLKWLREILVGPLKVAARVSGEKLEPTKLSGPALQKMLNDEVTLQ